MFCLLDGTDYWSFLCFYWVILAKATEEKREHWGSSGEAIAEFNADGTPKVEDTEKDNVVNK
ncbi:MULTISPECIES: hypothetical protein [unclassified Colwellia]|uniref:hypothetical protein n=1 Tax=unclassified Colwellia TaxID=196834 RepID=UPI0021751A28|nr:MULTISPECIES: hypothetical protein [unclassified Colwellia]